VKQLLLVVGLVACGGDREVTVDQYEEVALPGVEGARVYLDDVSMGESAPIVVRAAAGDIAKGVLYRGDQLPFVLGGKTYVVTVASYEDHLVVDRAHLRVANKEPKPPVYRIAPNTKIDAAGIEVSASVLDPSSGRVRVSIHANPSEAETPLLVGERMTFEHAGKRYEVVLLAHDGAGVYVRVRADRR